MKRRRPTPPGIAIALALAAAAIADGAMYYAATGGDDAADGLSAKTAFGTIGKGVSGLKPGDTLTILPGVYSESVSARISGAPDAPIAIRAWRPGTVLMRGDVDAPGFQRAEGLRYTWWADFGKRAEGVAERSSLRHRLLRHVHRCVQELTGSREERWLLRGLAAVVIEDATTDWRDTRVGLAALYQAARKARIKPEPVFQRIALIAENEARGAMSTRNILATFDRRAVKAATLPDRR